MRKTSPPDPRRQSLALPTLARGFSLIEVVLAVGIFAIAITMVIAMLASSARTQSEIVDRGTASRLAEAINIKLNLLGYDAVQGNTSKGLPGLLFPANQNPDSPGIDTTSNNSKVLYINKAGDKVGTYTDPVWGNVGSNNAEKYYEVMLVRSPNTVLSPPPDQSGANLNAFTASSVLFTVRITWPAYLPDGTAAPAANRPTRSVLLFNSAISR
jgi:prepilin-type N-terminal cleavage/methylation domain-containing protein